MKVAEVERGRPLIVNTHLSLQEESLLLDGICCSEREKGLRCLTHSVKEELEEVKRKWVRKEK